MSEQRKHGSEPHVRLILNGGTDSHSDIIANALMRAERAWLAVAFLTESGVELLRPALEAAALNGTRIRTFIGLSMGTTEPAALRMLNKLFAQCDNAVCFVCNPPTTFHPKLYVFTHKGSATLIAGSANLTGGGLTSNEEASILVRCDQDAPAFVDAQTYMAKLEAESWVELATPERIDEYERTRPEQLAHDPRPATSWLGEALAQKYIDLYRESEDEQADWARRQASYVEAKRLLMQMVAHPPKSADEFLAIYGRLVGQAGGDKLWHSGSIFRSKKMVAQQYLEFHRLLVEAKNLIGKPVDEAFDEMKPYMERTPGIGVNVMTEVLNTFAPGRFPVLNNNPLGSLRFFGLKDFPPPNSFKGADYLRYTKRLLDLQRDCQMEDLGRVDSTVWGRGETVASTIATVARRGVVGSK